MGVVLSAGASMGERKNNLGTKGSATPPENHLRNHRVRFYVAFLIISLFGAVPCANAQQDPFDAVASDVAAAVAKASRKHNLAPKVLVVDFSETKGFPTALGPDLARQFFLSLQAHSQNFTFPDRDDYLHQFAADKLTAESYANSNTFKCYTPVHDVAFIVTGEMKDLPDAIVIKIKTIQVKGSKVIFQQQVNLPITSAMQQFLTPGPGVAGSSGSDRPEMMDFPSHARVPKASANGHYSMPVCTVCRNPSFPPVAVGVRFQGTVMLNIRIGADGRVLEVALLRGLPCGLNNAAIEAVRSWKFRPAQGPDGQPAEVGAQVEVTFRLY
jgi:TonB family protein